MIVWVLILLILVALTIFIATYALPSIYLRLSYTIDKTKDRCIKRVYEKHGQSMIFEPEEKWRKYIEQYMLAERKGKKEFMCKVDKSLDYIELDVVVFNAMNKVSSVIRVKENVNGSGFTKPIELPEDTSYLSINISRADTALFEDHLSAKISKGKKAKFILINALMVIAEVICFKICFANLLGGLFRDSMIINLEGLILSGVVAVVLIILNTMMTVISVKIREEKFTIKVNKDA